MAIEVEIKLKIRDRQALAAKLTSWASAPVGCCGRRTCTSAQSTTILQSGTKLCGCGRRKTWRPGEKTAQLNFKGPKLDDASMTRREMETNVGDGGTVRAILEQIGFTPVIPVEKVRNYFHRDG